MTASSPADPVPVRVPADSCTLPSAERPLRVAEFDALVATALRDVRRPAPDTHQVRLVLAGDDTLRARVQQLADAEAACCSFFTFSVSRLGAEASGAPGETVVALDISVPPAYADVLAQLVARADAVDRAGPRQVGSAVRS